jgi:DNA-binding transcriptional MerR regulator
MLFMDYLIHEAAQLLGITGETLRHYERKGVIQYTRDHNSDYRRCDATDINILMRSRMYRSYGFSLREIGDLINQTELSGAADLLRQRRKELSREIERVNRVVRHLENDVALLDKAEQSVNCFERRILPPLFCLVYRRGDDITRDPQLRKVVSKWMDFMPFPTPLFVFSECTSRGWSQRYGGGFCLDPEDAAFLQVTEDCYIFRLEPLPCIYSVLKISSGLSNIGISLNPLFDRMKAEGFMPSGPVYGRSLISLKKTTDFHFFGECWIPYNPACTIKN